MSFRPVPLPASFSGTRCLVFGLGVSGSAVLRRLLAEGACAAVYDQNETVSEAGGGRVCRDPAAAAFDFVFRSPGIRPDHPLLSLLSSRGARVTGETEFFLSRCPCPVFGVTGSDGKTTTATLAYRILQAEGEKRGFRAHLGGNVGNSLLDALDGIRPNDYAILELSSFQLMDLPLPLSRVAITNVTENHLDYHRSFAEYADAKRSAVKAGVYAVLNGADPLLAPLARCHRPAAVFSARQTDEELADRYPDVPRYFLRDGILQTADGERRRALLLRDAFALPGIHNAENLLCAAALCGGIASPESVRRAAAFSGVPHRASQVRETQGVRFFDASIDTSPARTRATLSAFSRPPVVIAGGAPKGLSLSPLADVLLSSSAGAVLTGQTADEIARLLAAHDPGGAFPVLRANGMREAVEAAFRLAREKGTDVLLSPGCTSFDAYRNYAERGDDFARYARALSN